MASQDSRLFGCGVALLWAAAFTGIAAPVLAVFRRIPLSYNEGWNAFWADAAVNHGELYGPAGSLVSNNYPPLSFDLVGQLGRIVGDNVIAGRLVSLLSLFMVVAAVYLWLRAVRVAPQIALAGAALCLVTFAWFGTNYVAMNDPQMLAHAFMLAGAVLLARGNFSAFAVIVAAALMMLGGFTKHLLIPLPLAATLAIARFRRERLALWLACFAVGVPLGFWLTSQLHGSLFLQDLFSARAYSPPRALSSTIHVCVRFLPLLALAVIPFVKRLRSRPEDALDEQVWFAAFYLVLSLVIGGFASGGDGVTRNAFFDLLIAASLCAALGLASLQSRTPFPRPAPRLSAASGGVAFLGLSMAIYAAVSLPTRLNRIGELDALEQDTQATVQMIARLGNGHAACETLALCYWARSSFTMDFFNYGQKLKTGALSVADCKAALKRGTYPVLQLEPDDGRFGKRLDACAPAVDQFYEVAFRSHVGTLMVPRS